MKGLVKLYFSNLYFFEALQGLVMNSTWGAFFSTLIPTEDEQ